MGGIFWWNHKKVCFTRVNQILNTLLIQHSYVMHIMMLF